MSGRILPTYQVLKRYPTELNFANAVYSFWTCDDISWRESNSTYDSDWNVAIADVAEDDEPDPTELPLKLLNDFVHIKKTLGLWCAERAALLLIIKIDRLKTREKSERHYLLLSVLYTEMVRVRKICETAFNVTSDGNISRL